MSIEVKMPQMGESITEGTVVRWLKKPGDRVLRDEILFEISTDKVDTEVPSPEEGYLARILVPEGQTVPVNTAVCVLSKSPLAGTAPPAAPAEIPSQVTSKTPEAPSAPDRRSSPPQQEGRAEWLSPAVRRLVREHGVDVSQVRGSGEGGRVTREDVLEYVERRKSSPAGAETIGGGGAPFGGTPLEIAPEKRLDDRREPLSVMRRKIAEHMVLSRRTSAHVSTLHEADFSRVAALRERLKAEWARSGVKPTYLHFVLRAVALKLLEFPALNASLEGDHVHYKAEVNIGVAVALDDGLIVPVVRNADRLSLLETARRVNDLASRARSKALKPEDVQQGTFTITNPGVFGTLAGFPIIHQPQVAILCLGAVQKRAVVIEDADAIAVRSMAYLSLSFDHRLIDGATADRFLGSLRQSLESPEELVR